MPDNGFGGKANSVDFLIRAYYLRPHFKTADGGTGAVDVGASSSSATRPRASASRSSTRAPRTGCSPVATSIPSRCSADADGDLWVGDEFGPWILHFDSRGQAARPAVPGAQEAS